MMVVIAKKEKVPRDEGVPLKTLEKKITGSTQGGGLLKERQEFRRFYRDRHVAVRFGFRVGPVAQYIHAGPPRKWGSAPELTDIFSLSRSANISESSEHVRIYLDLISIVASARC